MSNKKYQITGGNALVGEVEVSGAKNSVLKLMAAALLAEGKTVLHNCPNILDVPLMAEVLKGLGAVVTVEQAKVTIVVPAIINSNANFEAVRHFRASICVLGPLLARCKQATVALPGGDAIGSRPLDMHQSALTALGARVEVSHGCVEASVADLLGGNVRLDFPSNGATENILMTAVLAEGTTILTNAAREPEIIDLCNMLTGMGAKIEGIGTSELIIHGVAVLQPVEHTVIGDRIVAATWATAAIMTQGDITISGVNPNNLEIVLEKYRLAGAKVEVFRGGFRVQQQDRPRALKISTLPYPGYPTDLQPMAVAEAAVSVGTSVITENIFESRFRFVDEMLRLGSDIQVTGHHAVIRGSETLSGADLWCFDIRAGAALALTALTAEGTSTLHDVFHIERGYPNFVDTVQNLGGKIAIV